MKTNNRNRKPQLYEGYLQRNVEMKEQEELQRRFGDDVVFKKVSTSAEILRIVTDLFVKILKLAFWGLVVTLCSIAVTVLINESTRSAFLNLFSM